MERSQKSSFEGGFLKEIDSNVLMAVIARILDNKLGSDISILNISNVSCMADYFVIASGDNPSQVRALTGYVREFLKKIFERLPQGEETDIKNRWNLLDYGDVVVHVLHKDERDAYAIEKFWNHACKVEEQEWMALSDLYQEQLI